ncbi:MAG: hypothetical protein LUG52_07695 [Clostridia bacterium]|nr:hypothetical protein [Clostridia bacterium]
MIRINNVKLPVGYTYEDALHAAEKKIGAKAGQVSKLTCVRRSIDARNKKDIFYLASFDAEVEGERAFYGRDGVARAEKYQYEYPAAFRGGYRPIVVGAGPAGLFAALILAYRGARPIILERGKCVRERVRSVEDFWSGKGLDINSNVQFGEGGAGTFSDGKLNTGTRDARQRKVLEEFAAAGAPESILYEAKPHIGTDKLRETVENLRKKIVSMGGEFVFECKMTDLIVKNGEVRGIVTDKGEILSEAVVLAIGHSARDTFEALYKRGVPMIRKPFSAGVRIEHLRREIDIAQYGEFAPRLPAADYKCSCTASSGRGVYTFCMCPGGRVVASASEAEGVVVNGMSDFARDAENSNSAILVSLYPTDFEGESPLAGMYFQRKLERAAFFQAGGNYSAPAQRAEDFFANRRSLDFGIVKPSYLPNVTPSNLRRILPEFISDGIDEAIHAFGRKIKGFDAPDAVLTGVETRSSSPVRIVRGEDFSSAIRGLYPCGEGAGYAGGIMSAAVDGIKVGEVIK